MAAHLRALPRRPEHPDAGHVPPALRGPPDVRHHLHRSDQLAVLGGLAQPAQRGEKLADLCSPAFPTQTTRACAGTSPSIAASSVVLPAPAPPVTRNVHRARGLASHHREHRSGGAPGNPGHYLRGSGAGAHLCRHDDEREISLAEHSRGGFRQVPRQIADHGLARSPPRLEHRPVLQARWV